MIDWMLQAALRSTLLLGLGTAVWPLLPRHRADWRRAVVLAGLALSLAAPFLPTFFGTAWLLKAPTPGTSLTAGFSWINALAFIWAIGTSVALLRLAWQALRLRRVMGRSVEIDGPGLGALPFSVSESREIGSPCLAGWWRPILLVPVEARGWTRERWRCVLCHEQQHLTQRDLAAGWLVRLAVASYWWHPLVHGAARQFHLECEFVCDRAVLRNGLNLRDYVETLLAFTHRAQPATWLPAPAMAGSSPLRLRLSRLLEFTTSPPLPRYDRWRLIIGLAAMVAITLAGGFCGLPSSNRSEPSNQPASPPSEIELRLSADPFPADHD